MKLFWTKAFKNNCNPNINEPNPREIIHFKNWALNRFQFIRNWRNEDGIEQFLPSSYYIVVKTFDPNLLFYATSFFTLVEDRGRNVWAAPGYKKSGEKPEITQGQARCILKDFDPTFLTVRWAVISTHYNNSTVVISPQLFISYRNIASLHFVYNNWAKIRSYYNFYLCNIVHNTQNLLTRLHPMKELVDGISYRSLRIKKNDCVRIFWAVEKKEVACSDEKQEKICHHQHQLS